MGKSFAVHAEVNSYHFEHGWEMHLANSGDDMIQVSFGECADVILWLKREDVAYLLFGC